MAGRQTLAALETAWRRDPQAVFVRLADACREEGALDRAVSLLRDGLSRWPHQTAAWVALARTLADAADTEGATAALAAALARDPDHWGALSLEAEFRRRGGDLAGEVQTLERLAGLAPGHAAIARRLALAQADAAHRPAPAAPSPLAEASAETGPMPRIVLRPEARGGAFRVRTTPSSRRPTPGSGRGTVPGEAVPKPSPSSTALPGTRTALRAPRSADPFAVEVVAELAAAQARAEAAGAFDVHESPDAVRDLLLAVADDLAALAAVGGGGPR